MTTTRLPSGGSTLERALVALEKMETKLAAVERARTEPLAIIGMGCRFPGGATSPAALWRLLRSGNDAVTEIPPERWSHSPTASRPTERWAGLLQNLDQFDAPFFGLSRQEAADMDPQQRLLLEVTWEALEDAGIPPEKLAGSKTAVFVGISGHDYFELLTEASGAPRPYIPTGNALSFAAGRIAHMFDLRGPCMSIDTACSSSLVALHHACQSLRRHECDLAIVGGTNVLLSAEISSQLASLQILSADGRCRTFDARANGFVRSEGAGVVVLERSSDAQRKRARVWALVRGSATNQNGRAASLAAPSLQAQAAVLRAALEDARVAPEQVGYIEVHSNGSPLGDPIELEALREAIGKPRADGAPCVLGSVKTSIGHAEAASGMASLIKAALVLNHETIPRNLHFQALNPRASIEGTPFRLPTSEVAWRKGPVPRIAGVSGTGLSGANAHVVVEEAPRATRSVDKPERAAHLLVLSGKTQAALRDRARQLVQHLAAHADLHLGDVCHTLTAGRAHFEHRLAAVVTTNNDATRVLDGFLAGAPGGHVSGQVKGIKTRTRIGFVVTGRPEHARGALAAFDAAPPALQEAARRGDEVVRAATGRSILPLLRGENTTAGGGDVDDALALFVLHYALIETWRAWGIEPHVVIGEETGTSVAAWASGATSLEAALELTVTRARTTTSGERQREELDIGLQRLSSEGVAVFVEIGPRATLGSELPALPSLRMDRPATHALLACVGELYVRGVDARWESLDAPHSHRRITLPTYPFQRERYWFDSGSSEATEEDVTPNGHPLLGYPMAVRADRPDVRAWELTLDPTRRAQIGVQRLAGATLLTSGGLVELAIAAAREAFGDAPSKVDLSFGDPPLLQDDAPATMQVIVTPEGNTRASVGIFFRAGDDAPWKRIAHGAIDRAASPLEEDEDEAAPPSMRPGRRQSVPAALWEGRLEDLGLGPGDIHIDQVWRRPEESLARVSLIRARSFTSFVRIAATLASITHPAAHGRAWTVEAVEGVSVRAASADAHAWLRLNWATSDAWSARVSVQLVGQDGEVTASAHRIDLRAQDPAAALRGAGKDPVEEAGIDLVWQEIPLSPPRPAKRRWLVLADDGGVGAALARQLEASGDRVATLPAAPLDEDIFPLDMVLGVSGPFSDVIYLGALDAPTNDALSPATLEDAIRRGAVAALRVVDRLAAQSHAPKLWLVTRGSQPIGDADVAISQSGLWGLGRVLSRERPDMWGGLIDLDPAPDAEEASRIAQALVSSGAEDHMALRGGKRYGARLTRAPLPTGTSPRVRPDRTHVVSGAWGPLGREATSWLVERGARDLLLVDDPTNPEAPALVRALETQGIRVVLAEVDHADVEGMRRALDRAPLPVGGIVHAMDAEDGGPHRLTSRETVDTLRAAVRAKLFSVWTLHALTAQAPLDHFVVFSSAASALGWEGLGADAVAAAHLDALVRHRRRAGLAATAVYLAFPAQERPGRTEIEQELLAAGFQGMPPSMALQVVDRMVSDGRPASIAAWIDWDHFEQAHRTHAGRPIFEGLGTALGTRSGAAALSRSVAAAEPEQARRIVESVVRGEIARVLGKNPQDVPASHLDELAALGMDSIMGVQVLTGVNVALNISLPVSVLLDHPTIEGLTRRALATLRRAEGEDPAAADASSRRGLLVELVRKGTKPPFFCAPPLNGTGLVFQSLVRHLGEDRPFYSFDAPGADNDEPPCDRVEVIAGRFLESMRRIQPSGPYRLGGYSFGALVAFEMAQSLARAGERVAQLVLVDLPVFQRTGNPATLLERMARLFRLSVDEDEFPGLSRDEQASDLAAALAERLMLPPELSESKQKIRMYRSHFAAMHSYVPAPYAGPVTLLRAEETVERLPLAGFPPDDPTFGWGALCSRVRVLDIPGNHFSAMFEPAVSELARVLRQALDEGDPG